MGLAANDRLGSAQHQAAQGSAHRVDRRPRDATYGLRAGVSPPATAGEATRPCAGWPWSRKRISRPQARESCEIPVGCEQLTHPVLQRQGGDVCIVDEVTQSLASLDDPSQVGRVARPLSEKSEGR